MTRPWGVAAAIVLLVVSPLLCTTTGIKNKEETGQYIVLQLLSQPNIAERGKATSNHYTLKKVQNKNFATLLYQSKNFPNKHGSNDEPSLPEINFFQHSNGIIKVKSNRKNSVFLKQSSIQISADSGLPDLQNLHTKASSKNGLKSKLDSHEAKKLAAKRILYYGSKFVPVKESLQEVNDVEQQYLKDKFPLKDLSDSNNVTRKDGLNIQRRIKRSVITLGDGETVICVNRSTINNTCRNDGNFILGLGIGNLNRNGSNGQLNNSFSNRNLKASKDFSSLSLSRLTLPAPRKKFVDITESGMGYRSPSTNEPSHKHHPTLRVGNDTSVFHKSVNISYMAPSVKPPGRLSAATSAPDNLDAASITGITLGSVVFLGIVGAMCFILYKRRNQNKPQTLSDKSSNPDSSVYIEESSDDSEEMYSLDNDSFLNSLEAMTIQNYWTENVKHTKL